jgi:predicted dehydrogenase/threonine dehydrogenase-like Zn-dependent dehydrogenase
MLVEFGKANLLEKARQQPDKVRQVLDKLKTDGIWPTVEAVRSKLDQPLPLGYNNAGVVLEVGPDVKGYAIGDRVASNGPHAEVVSVPKNLCVRIPDGVKHEEAAFTAVSAVALQGIRLIRPTLGESIAVIGLGMIGLITVQLLMAQGCRVLGVDLDRAKCNLASQFGANTADLSAGENPVEVAMGFSRRRGLDGVLITAATKSSEPIQQAAKMCRKRGRVVLVGVADLELNRSDFYEKELSFQVSCSYGPGRYDPEYEEKGHDYPLGYVRWTEQRNFEAVLDLMAVGKLTVDPLISHRFPFEDAEKAYAMISENRDPYLGIILEYKATVGSTLSDQAAADGVAIGSAARTAKAGSRVVVGLVGAGNFAGRVMLPALQKTQVRLKTIASSGGVTATHLGRKFGFDQSITEVERIFADPEINAVFISTRHDSHAQFVIDALNAGKHVFVEKPLCINHQQLKEIVDTYSEIRNLQSEIPLLMVGFNRRFAAHVVKMKQLLQSAQEPKTMVMTVNAGFIPDDHWTQDPEVGGGRIVGEACHFIDLLRFLVGHPIRDVQATMIGSTAGMRVREDKATFTLSFDDGSFGTVHYLASGHRSFPKERLEVFCSGRILQLQNFKRLRGYGWPGFNKMNLWRQYKGHLAEVAAFIEAVRHGGPAPIPFEELVESTRVAFQVMEALV